MANSAATGADAMAVTDAENWRIRVNHEQTTAKNFQQEWGFLTSPGTPDHLKAPHARSTVKYFTGRGEYTLLQKKVPLVGRDAERAVEQEREYLETASLNGGRPTTALQATLYSHSKRMDYIGNHDMALETSSRVYGSRHTLEQFGVSQFGLKESRSKLPPN
ncbi:hypothetical protein VOLCADRAFT_120581 [Volvox carteri f. nagariensis]|uniref:Uncharacterized protein n=1 Tax=Volvox carteri f. nagariensis TaxID=3068 RepID=D8TP72_VOLCA|nr:uncharacterized protein VOLCADRAFT_120581 [Volvox carteri f. nagariensis]EFJ50570.1 hypothetical protein VOLCADRAFT_120581 [Volvox carteri f. nagariensis]|eukprot:XP_002948163.1 hypothetical protein VOLCADRAFT_120581 [Volvox carteri f. nagariensis]